VRFNEIQCKMGQHDKNSDPSYASICHTSLFGIPGTSFANALPYVHGAAITDCAAPTTAALTG
jgi:hypothetical protein